MENQPGNNGNRASRCTILIDAQMYIASKQAALSKGLKLYEYINNILADAVNMQLPYAVKHKSVRKKKIKTEKQEVKVEATAETSEGVV